MSENYAIVCFSHLRWNFVYQRPQHLLSRLAARRRVLFLEEPVPATGAAGWERETPAPGVTVCRPRTPVGTPGFDDEQIAALRPLVRQLVAEEGLGDYLLWFYTPM